MIARVKVATDIHDFFYAVLVSRFMPAAGIERVRRKGQGSNEMKANIGCGFCIAVGMKGLGTSSDFMKHLKASKVKEECPTTLLRLPKLFAASLVMNYSALSTSFVIIDSEGRTRNGPNSSKT